MLAELAAWLATPASLRARRLGYLTDSIALMARARRCRVQWADHLERTRAAIRAAAKAADPAGAALVLGSGSLLDIPLAELAGRFARVVLVDAVHPWPARRASRRYANVARVTADLSGAGPALSGTGPVDPPVAALARAHGAGLVVSANLLSQLPIIPVATAEKRRRADPDGLGRAIVLAHLAALSATRAHVCLVTDTVQIEEDRAGTETDRLDLLHGVTLPESRSRWVWELAPFGEVSRRHRLLHHVHAFPDWRPAGFDVAACRHGTP